jgi:hypothetical protein
MLRKTISILIAVLLVVIIFTGVGLYYVMKDLAYYAGGALQPLEEKTGFRISFDDVGWRLSFGVGVTVKNLKIIHIATGTTVLASERNYLQLRLFPLLRRHVVVSKIIIDNPRLDISRNQNGTWPFSVLLPEGFTSDNGGGPAWFPFSVTVRQSIITNGELKLHDYQHNTFFHFQKLDADLSRPMLLEPYRLLCSAQLLDKKELSHIAFTGTVNPESLLAGNTGSIVQGVIDLQKMDISLLLPYLSTWKPGAASEGFLDAHVDFGLTSGPVFNAAGWLKFDSIALPLGFDKPFLMKKVYAKIDLSGNRDSFDLKNCVLTIPGIELKGSASVSGLPQAPVIDAHISTGPLTWKVLRPMICGTVLKRYLTDYSNSLKDATISIKKLHLRGCFADDASTTLELCNGYGEISNISMHIKDTMPQLLVTSGSFTISKDKLAFSEVKAQWFSKDAHVVNGAIMQPFTHPFLDMKVETTAPAETLLQARTFFVPESATNLFSPGSGIMKATTQICFPFADSQQVQLSSALDLSQLEYSIGNICKKPLGQENKATVKTTFTPGSMPAGMDFSCSLNNNSLQLSGALKDMNAPSFTGLYTMRDMDIKTIGFLFMPSDISLQGILNGKGTITVPLTLQEPTVPDIQGTIDVARFSMLKAKEPLPLLFLNLKGFLKDESLHVTEMSGNFGLTTARCRGEFLYGVNPLGQFKTDVAYLNLDDFIETVIKLKNSFNPNGVAHTQVPVHADDKKTFFRRFVLNAPATVKKGKYLSWDFTDVTTRITIKDGVMTYGDINLHAYRGVVTGSVIHDFSQPGTYRLTFLPRGTGVQFEEFLPELQAKKVIAGKLNLDGMFTSLYRKGNEVVPNMEGNFKINMKEAKLGKFTVVSKILSLLSFSEIVQLHMPALLSKGMPLESVDGRFVMAHGIAHTEDLFMRSPAMNLSAVGDLNFSRKELNLIVGVQPLETIGKLLGSIPIAGKILTGENKSITVSYFQVSGPYADCSVKPIPVESLSQGVKALFNRFYNLPHEILNTGKKQTKGS